MFVVVMVRGFTKIPKFNSRVAKAEAAQLQIRDPRSLTYYKGEPTRYTLLTFKCV